MSYIDAHYYPDQEIVKVVERVDGKRIFKEFPINYTAYYNDSKGKHETIFGTRASQIQERTRKRFNYELKLNKRSRIYESDFNQVFRVLGPLYLKNIYSGIYIV